MKSFVNWDSVRAFLRKYLSLGEYVDTEAGIRNIRSNIPFRGPTVYILFVAVIIASVGLNVNSIPVIIGAMLISPLMGPIIGFGLGLGMNDRQLLHSSLKHLGIMVGVSLLASTLYFLLTPLEADNPTELLARTNPSIYDVFIAFFGGLAGVLEITRKEKGTVISGVAIATALMPPLCTVGYGLANLNWYYAGGALYLFFINSVFIALATYLAARFLKFPQVEEKPGRYRQRLISYTLLLLIVIAPSVFSAYSIVRENEFQKSVRHFVRDNQSVGKTYIYDYAVDTNQKPFSVSLRLAGESLDEVSRDQLYDAAEKYGLMRSQLVFLEDATFKLERLNDKEIMQDWMQANERQLQLRDDSIRALSARLSAYERQVLPAVQLAGELRSQWPDVTDVTVARGIYLPSADEEKEQVLVLLQSTSPVAEEDRIRMENWLTIRLQVPSVRVVVLP
jgi:uncharacterized hydrophobic protein (TIGR00271 family)